MARRGLEALLRFLARLSWFQRVALGSAVAAVSLTTWIWFGPASLERQPPLQNAFLYDRNGTLLAELAPDENRVIVPLSKVPTVVQEAFVAAEDGRFWSHPGVDPLAIARALWADIHGGREGASTITQQYVKNTFVGSRRAFGRKVREAIVALRIDRRFSKKQILEAYLNSIYLGQGAYGVEAASRLYFGTSIEKVTLPQAAMLAGLTVAPSRYSPRTNFRGALMRRDHVLDRMLSLRMVSPEQAERAKRATIRLAPPRMRPVRAPAFVDWVRGELLRRFGEERLYRGGLRVTTSLDLNVQRAAEEAVAEVLGRPGDPDAAVVTIDVATGEVRAMVGGRGRKLGDLNLATQGYRQPGSAFKPIVLAAALAKGKSLDDRYRAPGFIRVTVNGIRWPVRNYDRRSYGRPTLRRATAYSVNTVFAQLIRDVGPQAVVDMARRLGIRSSLRAVPSLALGTSNVTLLELASAYTAFADAGLLKEPTGLHEVKSGRKTLRADAREPDAVIPVGVADDVKEALGAVTSYGTGSRARVAGFKTYGKTGTTEENRDAWFVGWAGKYLTAVWVGHPSSNKPMTRVHGIRVTGSSFPATIWMRTMRAALIPPSPAVKGEKGKGSSQERPGASSEPSPLGEPSTLPSESPSPEPSGRPIPIPIPTIT